MGIDKKYSAPRYILLAHGSFVLNFVYRARAKFKYPTAFCGGSLGRIRRINVEGRTTDVVSNFPSLPSGRLLRGVGTSRATGVQTEL
jgi:hypothetical protein